jgi:hypothetical protein
MKPKFAVVAFLSTAALSGAMLFDSIAHACPFADKVNGLSGATTAVDPVDSSVSNSISNGADVNQAAGTSTITTADAANSQPNQMQQLAIAGAGLAAVGGLVVGGVMLKKRFNRDRLANSSVGSQTQAEMLTRQSEFSIAIPPEVLADQVKDQKEVELNSTRP